MIKREEIDRLPTSIRDGLKSHFEQCAEKAKKEKERASVAYTITNDETQKATALISFGEQTAFETLINIFK